MKVALIRIGNSLGVRLPKAIIKQCHFGALLEGEVKNGAFILRASGAGRKFWLSDIEAENAKQPIQTGEDTW